MSTSIKLIIQNFGRFLSNMIMPNISIFITWGIMTALFSSTGWCPNSFLEQLISPIIFYLLPLSIGYTGGCLISGTRGGLVGIISTMGIVTNSNVPMLLGSMIVGPISGWIIQFFDKKINKKIKSGFEMLVNNFSIAIIGSILSIISFSIIGPLITYLSYFLGHIIKLITDYNLLPFVSIIIEPAKIFFLNNVINHGFFSPLGVQDILNQHSSIFFLIESNPGPGFGILMAWLFFGTGDLSKSSGSAAIIQLFGGIHEIYFPYVLTKPKLIFSLILGGMTGIFMLTLLHGGLISAASPGSILSILAMTPKGLYFSNIGSIFCSFLVSFISSAVFLQNKIKIYDNKCQDRQKKYKYSLNLEKLNNREKNDNLKSVVYHNIKTIIFACDAGMGSSAMGASILRKKIKEANLMDISVLNLAINLLPKNADLIITHQDLTHRAKKYTTNAQHISLKNFLNHEFYDNLVKNLVQNKIVLKNRKIEKVCTMNRNNADTEFHTFQLSENNILLNQIAENKEEAIKIVGKHLVKQGYVTYNYIDSMLEREKISSTWLGESIALPHGTIESKNFILKTGIMFCQFPKGIRFGENINDIAYLIIGIAAKNNEHVKIVSNLTNALDNKDIIKKLSTTKNIQEVLSLLIN
ncbi:MAG: PTS mannitol transporter subunit IICBA [Buchnera aphidicola (Pentalonia nigronervosa)]|uniref:PTS system mannitol-specific EIICBA component n=1 Tax=Buchnera aphidicola (Pentalonia nigronervosa) TaxID=1309793 RepID=A0A7H1AZ32_9GAMM|nr:MAG: PTS mannitol transporter subunit IICBA [Buchnera aphidicola (Pentalonia nigronervosa)]